MNGTGVGGDGSGRGVGVLFQVCLDNRGTQMLAGIGLTPPKAVSLRFFGENTAQADEGITPSNAPV